MDAFTKIMQEYVDLGEIEGASARIVHKGKDLYRGCVGCSDVATRRPFGFDDIVCIFSLTKMVIGVAALKLWEQGGFRMDDPVSDYIPAFGNATVYWPTEKGPVIRPAPETCHHPQPVYHDGGISLSDGGSQALHAAALSECGTNRRRCL